MNFNKFSLFGSDKNPFHYLIKIYTFIFGNILLITYVNFVQFPELDRTSNQ